MLAIFPGHFAKDCGAKYCDTANNTKSYEVMITAAVSAFIVEWMAGVEEVSVYSGTLEKRVAEANDNPKIDLGVSIHVDSFTDLKANGAHCCCWPRSKDSFQLADLIKDEWIKRRLIIPKARSNWVEERSDLYILRKTRFPVVLLEMGFLSNYEDREMLLDFKVLRVIGSIVAGCVGKWYDLRTREI